MKRMMLTGILVGLALDCVEISRRAGDCVPIFFEDSFTMTCSADEITYQCDDGKVKR
jgi:hypothetical protein